MILHFLKNNFCKMSIEKIRILYFALALSYLMHIQHYKEKYEKLRNLL